MQTTTNRPEISLHLQERG